VDKRSSSKECLFKDNLVCNQALKTLAQLSYMFTTIFFLKGFSWTFFLHVKLFYFSNYLFYNLQRTFSTHSQSVSLTTEVKTGQRTFRNNIFRTLWEHKQKGLRRCFVSHWITLDFFNSSTRNTKNNIGKEANLPRKWSLRRKAYIWCTESSR